MNKLLMFPIAVMFIISIMIYLDSSIETEGVSENYTDSDGMIIEGTESENVNVSIPKAGPQSFNIWENMDSLVILLAAIAIGIVAGISVLGSGLSETSQGMIFNSVLFLGLWACLSIVSATLFFMTTIGSIVWLGLTTMFIIGLAILMTGE